MNCQTPAVLCPPLIKPSPVFLCFWSSDLSPVPAVVSFTCLCSLLLTCSCDSSWNKVRPLTCLQSPVIWAQLVYSHCDPICQEISFCFVCVFFFFCFFFRIIIINSEKKKRKQSKSGARTLHRSTSRAHETSCFILICPFAVRVRQLARLQNHLTRNECRLYTFTFNKRARCYCVFVGILYSVHGVIEVVTGQL